MQLLLMDVQWGQDGDRRVARGGRGVANWDGSGLAFSAGGAHGNEVWSKVVIADLFGTRERSDGVVVDA